MKKFRYNYKKIFLLKFNYIDQMIYMMKVSIEIILKTIFVSCNHIIFENIKSCCFSYVFNGNRGIQY